MRPQLQSTCHYIVNHYVDILHVRLGGANNMRPLSWGGANGKDPKRRFKNRSSRIQLHWAKKYLIVIILSSRFDVCRALILRLKYREKNSLKSFNFDTIGLDFFKNNKEKSLIFPF